MSMSMSTVSFLAQLESGILPKECFPLTYDLSLELTDILTITSFYTNFLYALIFCAFFSCNKKKKNFIKGIVPIYIVFLKKLKPLFLYLTY